MKIIPGLMMLLLLCSCQKENDFIIDNERAGLLKLGQQETKVKELLSAYQIDSKYNGVYPQDKYVIVSDNNKTLMHLHLHNNILEAMKIFDRRYKTAQGIKIGTSAQEVANREIYFHLIHFGDHEGLRCELLQKNILGKKKQLTNLQFYFSRRIYQDGAMRYIGKDAKLQSFLIGGDFNIKYEVKTAKERELLRLKKHGNVEDGYFINNYYNLKIKLPNNWSYHDTYMKTEDVVDIFLLKNNDSNARLSLSIIENTNGVSGKTILNDLGIPGKLELFDKREDYTIFRIMELSKNDHEHRVYYSATVKENSLLFVGKENTYIDLLEIEEIIKGLEMQ
ncbi:hypothetical protein DMA11_21890 [Marinilabiliaceae bacterium JC017]|nr:hypothetical protein DMA11_21890 [Marinilabiliaceae bacterium JC017]